MGNAIIYTRVSTKSQAEEGYSLASQEKDCRAFAIYHNYNIVKVFIEQGESAKTQARTELQKLLKYCMEKKKEIDALIIWKIDRLSRDAGDYHQLTKFFEKLNIKLLFARENNDEMAEGKLIRNLMGVIAQFENDQKAERVTAGMKEAFKQGKWLWRAPKGYIYENGKVFPDPQTAPIITKIFERFSTGLYQQTQLIDFAKKNNIKIQPSMMSEMLRNPFYIGYMPKNKWSNEPIRGSFEPIVSEKVFNKVQTILSGKKPIIGGYSRNNPSFPLRQYITCPNCNQPLTASNSKGRNQKYSYYHCYNKDCSINFRIPTDRLHTAFVQHLQNIKPATEFMELFKAIVTDIYKEKRVDEEKQKNALRDNIETLKDKKSKLIDFKIDGTISQEDYDFKSAQITMQLQEYEFQLANIMDIGSDMEKCLKYACSVISNLDEFWLNATLDIKQRLQQLIYPQGLTYDLNNFRTTEMSSLFKIIGTLSVPSYNMVPPSEFESLSTP